MGNKKVFCEDCRYYTPKFVDNLCGDFTPERCTYPQNRKDTYLKPDSDYNFQPCNKNHMNDCEWYEAKDGNRT